MLGILSGIILALIIGFCSIVCITNKNEKVGIVLLLCDVCFVCFWVV